MPQAASAGELRAVQVLGVRVPSDNALLAVPLAHDLMDTVGAMGMVRFELDDGVFPYGDFVVKE